MISVVMCITVLFIVVFLLLLSIYIFEIKCSSTNKWNSNKVIIMQRLQKTDIFYFLPKHVFAIHYIFVLV